MNPNPDQQRAESFLDRFCGGKATSWTDEVQAALAKPSPKTEAEKARDERRLVDSTGKADGGLRRNGSIVAGLTKPPGNTERSGRFARDDRLSDSSGSTAGPQVGGKQPRKGG